MSEPNPEMRSGMPWCSRTKCPLFVSRVESGWGLYENCLMWDILEHGKKPLSFNDSVLCRPQLLKES